jgi:2-C-methyl-D-erythritol 2,4-cyclodiphosphate synthase
MLDIRVGNGFDVHAFAEGNEITLCGLKIPFSKKLLGHSDADVGLHAITDALYGAIASGDIGTHFPPSDNAWRDAASTVFLKHAVQLVEELGFKINNIDCTIICEQPKIGPLSNQMKSSVSKIMDLDISRISIKATTSEKLGFTGREEGIAALATATVCKFE